MGSAPVGAITALYGDLLCGWAFDPAHPDQRLVVEIMLDGQPVAIARADQWQPLEQQRGDGCHGFSVPLRPSWLQQGWQFSACIANRGTLLDGRIDLFERAEAKSAPPVAEVRFDGGLRLHGWVWDPLDPNRHVCVRAYEHERCLAETIADRLHPALIDRPTADHGFVLDLPWALADGERHLISLVDERGTLLPGGRITVCVWPDGLSGLLRDALPADSEQATAARALALRLADHQDRLAPKALGFGDYPLWLQCYELPDTLATDPAPMRVGVLVYGETDGTGQARSRSSLEQQRRLPAAVATVTESEVLVGVEQLLAQGCEAILPLRAGDGLAGHALDMLVSCLRPRAGEEQPAPAWVYADCDNEDGQGSACDPWLKPAWDPDLFFGIDLISNGGLFSAAVVRAALQLLEAESLAGVRSDAAAIHWLLAAVVAVTQEQGLAVAHLPRLLYRRAELANQVGSMELAAAHEVDSTDSPELLCALPSPRQAALQWLAQRWAPGASVEGCPGRPGLTHVIWPLPQQLPKVTCIVPTRDRVDLLRPCIEGLLTATDYPALEVIVIDNGSCCPKTLAYLAELPQRGVRLISYPYPFNFSAMNNLAVQEATGELICLLNNDILVREGHWLKAMVREALRPGVGAVGAKLLWPNTMVQHGGVILGIHGLAAHVGNHWQINDAGYLGFNQLTRRYSALTAACLMLPRALYQETGGLDPVGFPVTFNDVDLCLRIRARGLALVWTPFARLEHLESASRGRDEEPAQAARARREQEQLRQSWSCLREADPAYHPGLAHDWGSGPYGALRLGPMPRTLRYHRSCDLFA